MKRLLGVCTLLAAFLVVMSAPLSAQGVTTSSIRGLVRNTDGGPIAGARVTALHEPSGTSYIGTSRADGRVTIPGMRVGGPYRVTATAIGYQPVSRGDVYLSLGVASDLNFEMQATAVTLQEITALAQSGAFSSTRTGASTQIGNIAPYDVRQGNFVGAGVNAVTKSGTNEFSGSAYFQYRNESMVGTKAGELDFNPGTFKYDQIGVRLGGPIIRNKLFFFANYEKDNLEQPGTTFRANTGGETVEGSVTRVLESDLSQLSDFLRENYGYETGAYAGYTTGTP